MDFKKCIVESGKKLENSGLTVETWGNISIRDPETGLVYLTPSAMKYSTIVEDDVWSAGWMEQSWRVTENQLLRQGCTWLYIETEKR